MGWTLPLWNICNSTLNCQYHHNQHLSNHIHRYQPNTQKYPYYYNSYILFFKLTLSLPTKKIHRHNSFYSHLVVDLLLHKHQVCIGQKIELKILSILYLAYLTVSWVQ